MGLGIVKNTNKRMLNVFILNFPTGKLKSLLRGRQSTWHLLNVTRVLLQQIFKAPKNELENKDKRQLQMHFQLQTLGTLPDTQYYETALSDLQKQCFYQPTAILEFSLAISIESWCSVMDSTLQS